MGPTGDYQRLYRLPEISGGGGKAALCHQVPRSSLWRRVHRSGKIDVTMEDDGAIEDPDLLSGVIDAPPALAMEMADLVRFKTSALTSIGFQRSGVWGEETASQKIEHLGLMFGALAASKAGEIQGCGCPCAI